VVYIAPLSSCDFTFSLFLFFFSLFILLTPTNYGVLFQHVSSCYSVIIINKIVQIIFFSCMYELEYDETIKISVYLIEPIVI